jgi:hypothetical protein
VCAYLEVQQMWTHPRYSAGVAICRSGSTSRLISSYKLLMKGKLREWDGHLPMVVLACWCGGCATRRCSTWSGPYTPYMRWCLGERHSSALSPSRICLW